jgi:hypothetical protein
LVKILGLATDELLRTAILRFRSGAASGDDSLKPRQTNKGDDSELGEHVDKFLQLFPL